MITPPLVNTEKSLPNSTTLDTTFFKFVHSMVDTVVQNFQQMHDRPLIYCYQLVGQQVN